MVSADRDVVSTGSGVSARAAAEMVLTGWSELAQQCTRDVTFGL